MLIVIGAVLHGIVLLLKEWAEINKDKREKIKDLRKDYNDAIDRRDYAYATLLWDRVHKL